MVIRPYEFGQVPIATPIAKGSIVKGGGKVGHVGGLIVDSPKVRFGAALDTKSTLEAVSEFIGVEISQLFLLLGVCAMHRLGRCDRKGEGSWGTGARK